MNILIIGVGHHAKRIYIPSLQNNLVDAIYGLDVLDQKQLIDSYISSNKISIKMFYTDILHSEVVQGKLLLFLNDIVDKNNIKAVIISTDPLSHYKYAKWALEKGLHILMDKPVTSEKNICTSEVKAKKILTDFKKLERLYKKFKKEKHLVFSLMSQRRYHPIYRKMKEKVSEIFDLTNCPITSIQTSHADGQWRTPDEIIDLTYHGYNLGYGKCSHSGYHSMDMINWILSAAESGGKIITHIEVVASFSKPVDFLHQINYADYEKFFPNFNASKKYSKKYFLSKTKSFGEIDAFSNLVFKSGSKIQTLCSLNLMHNGFSQRGWLSAEGKNLYKGNGRIRQEQYFIEQGPFQSLSLITYQSTEVGKDNSDLFSLGKEFHIELHVFRNSSLFPHLKTHEVFNMRDYANMSMQGYSRGHQEDARRDGVLDFLHAINENRDTQSDFLDHKRGTILLSAIYQSAVMRNLSKNPLVRMHYKK